MRYLSIIGITLAFIALIAVPAASVAQTGIGGGVDRLLREYLLPVTAYEDAGQALVIDGRDCFGFLSSDYEVTTAPDTLPACPVLATGEYPVQTAEGATRFRVRVPESGLYKIEVTTRNPGGASFFYATDAQVQSIWNEWGKSPLAYAFGNRWTALEQQQAVRNYVTRVMVDGRIAGYALSPNTEPNTNQSGFITTTLTAGDRDIVLSFVNDLQLRSDDPRAPRGCLPGGYNQIANVADPETTPDCVFDRDVAYVSLKIVKARETTDVIGVRVYTNTQSVEPRAWYTRNVISANPNVTEIEVDGYPAVRDGNTVYVNAANVPDEGGFYTNVYVIAYNTNAAPTTQTIFNQMLANWDFNTNIISRYPVGYEEVKDRLRRDVRRLADINRIREAIESYRVRTGAYPTLTAGTFVPGHSINNWPSWNTTLGAQLGISLPTDPLSKFVAGDQPIRAYDCRRDDAGNLIDPSNAGKCDVICSRDAAGNPLTGCSANQQCLGDYCSICPVGYDPNTCWNAERREFYPGVATAFEGCGPLYDGAFKLGATSCEPYNGAYMYQYTSIRNGQSYALNYRLEYTTTTGCRADQCEFNGTCYEPGSCLAGCDASGQNCVNPQLRNSVCYLGQWRQSCGDGFLQATCGEACDPNSYQAEGSYCSTLYGVRDWHNQASITGQCTPQCQIENVAGGRIPPAYHPDPNIISCGGYCGDQITQFRYGEECDLGALPGVLRLPHQGGSGGVGSDSQYLCTGAGSRSVNVITDGSFENASAIVVGLGGFEGQAGDWGSGRVLNNGAYSFVAQPDNAWILDGSAYRGLANVTGISDNNIVVKRWVPYADISNRTAGERTAYYNESGNAGLSLSLYPRIAESVTGVARTGVSSVRLLDTGPKETATWTRAGGIVPGTEYEFTAYLRQDTEHYWGIDRGKKEVFVEFHYQDREGYALEVAPDQYITSYRGADGLPGLTMDEIPSGSWREVRMKTRAPENAAFVQIVIRTDYFNRGAALFVDDVAFTSIAGCKTTGGWCGDGILQSSFDERCDTFNYQSPTPAETVNIVKNAGFEGVFAPWISSPEPTISIVTSESFSGRGSLRILASTIADERIPVRITQSGFTLFAGQQYKISLKAKRESGDLGEVIIRYGSSENGSESAILTPTLLDGRAGWVEYAATVTPTRTADHVTFEFSFTTTSIVFYIDDALVYPVRGAGAIIPQYTCGTGGGRICQFTGGYCGDGVVQAQFGEVCDDAYGTPCSSNAQCGATGQCVGGYCTSNSCDQYCRGTFCGDGIVSRPNSLGVMEECDTFGDPTCYFDCQFRTLGGVCAGDFTNTDVSPRCAPNLSCAVRQFGDTDKICLGTRGSYGCRTNADCVIGYYCDARTTRCEPEISTYLRYHPETGGQVVTVPAPSSIDYNVHPSVCPFIRTVTAGNTTYALDTCTNIFWVGTDSMTRVSWTYREALNDACGGVTRVPTIDELYSLVRQSQEGGNFFSDKERLKLCCVSCAYDDNEADLCQDKVTDDNYLYWSSTCVQRDAAGLCTRAMAINFKYGSVEEYATTDRLKVRCMKETTCGNGVIEEGEQCEFYTAFTPAEPRVQCTQDSQCATGTVCVNGQCGTRTLYEQPISRQCSEFGWDGGFLHCDRATCLLRQDNCVAVSQKNRTCNQVCADKGLRCKSVGLDIDRSDEVVNINTNDYRIAQNGLRVRAQGNQCSLENISVDPSIACGYSFIDQGSACTFDGTSAPFTPEYAYCNCI